MPLILIILLIQAALAGPAEEREAVERIKADLSPYVKVLSREIQTFHWNNLDDVSASLGRRIDENSIHIKSPEIIQFANKWRDQVWSNSATAGDLGYGFYTANTPVSSSEWRCRDWYNQTGCNFWIMGELKIAAGSKFLDLRYGRGFRDNIKLSLETIEYLNQNFRCNFSGQMAGTSLGKNLIALKKIEISSSYCGKFLSSALKELDLSFITYQWYFDGKTRETHNCNMPQSKVAFLILNAPINEQTMTVFSSKNYVDSSEMAEYTRFKTYLEKYDEPQKFVVRNLIPTGRYSWPNAFYCSTYQNFKEDLPF